MQMRSDSSLVCMADGKTVWAGLRGLENVGTCSGWVEKTRADVLFRDKLYAAAAAAYERAMAHGLGDTSATAVLHSDLGSDSVLHLHVSCICMCFVLSLSCMRFFLHAAAFRKRAHILLAGDAL